jgi:hypothetical protein
MLSSTDAVKCTVRDGAMWIQLDNESVKIPQQLLNKSKILMEALCVAEPSVTRSVTLAAPKEWLQAWVLCYCNEEESLRSKDINKLISCMLVCFLCLERSSHGAQNRYVCRTCIHSLSRARVNTSSVPDSVNLILFPLLLGSEEGRLVIRRLQLASLIKAEA